MTDSDDWERVGRETLHHALDCLLEDADATVEPVADAVYWDHDVSAEQVEAMRQLAFDLEYVTEAYLARLCEATEPWDDEQDRTSSRLPAVSNEESAVSNERSAVSDEGSAVSDGNSADEHSAVSDEK